MDLRMPVMDGVAATPRLCEIDPEARVLVLTTYDRDGDTARATQAGASGYLLNDAPRDELHRAVRAAARGEVVLAPAIAAHMGRGDGGELSSASVRFCSSSPAAARTAKSASACT
jgi:DNA-binding NarL/FixJ family response regulator